MAARTLGIIVLAGVLVIGGVAYLLISRNSGGSVALPGSSFTDATATANIAGVPASQALAVVPSGAFLTVGTPQGNVMINNFYTSNPLVFDSETVLVKKTASYSIAYDNIDSSFWIGINSDQSVGAVRPVAEEDFLATLGVSKADACKLNVAIGVNYSQNSGLSGQSFPLSFCSGSAFSK